MNFFAVTLPMPPSVNNMFATFNGRRIISREYKAWRAVVGGVILQAWTQQGRPKFERHLALTVHIGLGYRGDISNRLKAIEDALGESIPGFPDDRYIERIEIERVTGIDGARVMVQQCAKPRLCEAVPIGELIPGILHDITKNIEANR